VRTFVDIVWTPVANYPLQLCPSVFANWMCVYRWTPMLYHHLLCCTMYVCCRPSQSRTQPDPTTIATNHENNWFVLLTTHACVRTWQVQYLGKNGRYIVLFEDKCVTNGNEAWLVRNQNLMNEGEHQTLDMPTIKCRCASLVI
jgi:hypothetical protein